MLGFAIVDRQPGANATAVWLTTRVDDTRVNHTNAVLIDHHDEDYGYKVWALTADRAVVLTDGTTPATPFTGTLTVASFNELIDEAFENQQRISDAVAAARTSKRKLMDPDFPCSGPVFVADERDEPQYRALAVANYIAKVWRFWLLTDEQRVRRTVDTRTGEPPGIMPHGLDQPALAAFPPTFAAKVTPEPVRPGRPVPC
ncbi:hypothetical protein H7J77_10185 [Mycolicibacillus parakoreensis]|uniref:Uncharacterized protein n=1 Tax=Mycolicibacillus parakoreensis TaxID=1069221 RepID=A0ABY3TXQ8_9MYCO|nr:hypothetical protein [Mycolicibacillus parakoreensis]MCV7315908.1 hypothetical protein [Mycolicibacillus parakoreensis]ULN52460.1 hypothetical protein MIU77_16725 [Mycolicibacillus parakoreensis]